MTKDLYDKLMVFGTTGSRFSPTTLCGPPTWMTAPPP